MNRALLDLMTLQYRSVGRRTLRGVKSWRGALLLLFTLGFLALMIAPQVFTAIAMKGRPEMNPLPGVFEPLAPLYLLGFTLLFAFTSAGEVAVSFTPAEVDFLFAAPFDRRELLLYKLAKTGLAIVFASAFTTLMMMAILPRWLSGTVGIALALAMAQLVGMIVALIGQLVAESVYTRARRIVMVALLLLAAWGLAQGAGKVQAGGLAGLMGPIRQSPAFRVLLAPFEVFTHVIFARNLFPDLVGWGAAALAIDAALVAVVLRLDANYLEAAATISQKVYERMRRAKQGGGIAMAVGPRASRSRLPDFPWIGGVGPVAWRQGLIVLRSSRHLLIASTAIIGIALSGFLMSPGPASGDGAATRVAGFGIGMAFYLTFLFSMQLPWAFRGDLDHIEMLKTLPIGSTPLALGELTAGVLALSLIQLVLFAVLAAVAPAGWPVMVVAAAFSLPFNALMLATNNLLFLIYPVRQPTGTTFDFQMFGKVMLFFSLQFALLVPMLGIPGGLGAAAYLLSGYSTVAFAATAWAVMVVELVPIVLAVAWAFHRFDVSTQIPA